MAAWMKLKAGGASFDPPTYDIFDSCDERQSQSLKESQKFEAEEVIHKSFTESPSTKVLQDVTGKYVQLISATTTKPLRQNLYARHKLKNRYL